MKKTVLVSGGAGFIGSHVTVELVQAGYDVVIADNFSNCDETNYKGVCAILGREIPLVPMDFCDKAAVYSLFEKYPIDAVIHFAAFKAVGESMTEPLKYYRNNLLSFMNILDAAKHQGGCNVLFSSSATVYGQTDKLPVTEETPRQPAESPYGNTKTMCEDILRDSVKAYAGVRGIALRYFNPIGAHPSALIGELPRGVPNNLVPFLTQTAIGRRECLSVYGNDYPTPDGTCLRDFIDIVDLAKEHVFAVTRMVEGRMTALRTGTDHHLRTRERPQAELEVRSAPSRRRGGRLGRSLPGGAGTRLEGGTPAGRHPEVRLGLGEASCRAGLTVICTSA